VVQLADGAKPVFRTGAVKLTNRIAIEFVNEPAGMKPTALPLAL
jgi:hypothetical protein